MNSKETIKDYVKAGICLGLFILASASDTEYQIYLEQTRQTATSRPLATQLMEQTMSEENTPVVEEKLNEENTKNTDTDTDTDTEEETVSVTL